MSCVLGAMKVCSDPCNSDGKILLDLSDLIFLALAYEI